MSDSWAEILWRESYFCYNDDYTNRLQKLISHWSTDLGREEYLITQRRPSTMAVEAALRQACQERRSKYGWDRRLHELDETRRQALSLEELLDQLNAHHWLNRIIACHLLVPFGGEAVEPLSQLAHDNASEPEMLELWILHSIGVDTTHRWRSEADQLLCPTCFVHCYPLEISVSGYELITYYGCRACGQSRDFKTWPKGVVATLNADMSEDHLASNGMVRVNWLQRRTPFDFDWIEIIQATDEDIERFAVQAGNDTDPVRKPDYADMGYMIDATCQLSENTLRVLDKIFGEQQQDEEPPMREATLPWQKILWREWSHCQDSSYKRRLGRLVSNLDIDWKTKTAGRPTTTEVEKALFEACKTRPLVKSTWAHILDELSRQLTQPDSVNQLLSDLDDFDWTVRFVARHTLVALGGESVPGLVNLAANNSHPQQETLEWMLRNIELETTARLYPLVDKLVCPRCLVRCHAHWIDVPGVMPLAYYGCRSCGQSLEFLEWTGNIVTVLDTEMSEPFVEQDDAIRGNWFSLRKLFDCEWVEIIRTTDEDVERFAMQIGNDTDEVRRPKYKEMRCIIDPACELSENTMRVLDSMFGEVHHAPIP